MAKHAILQGRNRPGLAVLSAHMELNQQESEAVMITSTGSSYSPRTISLVLAFLAISVFAWGQHEHEKESKEAPRQSQPSRSGNQERRSAPTREAAPDRGTRPSQGNAPGARPEGPGNRTDN